ncbi:superoxide dismutase [Novosphingobium aquiterrae]|uniref:Superoxide dismutase n=1 Tax=Novosphingobium aquiterrae TaxID=624388 RepID=A0ABV6PI98_9SPHN
MKTSETDNAVMDRHPAHMAQVNRGISLPFTASPGFELKPRPLGFAYDALEPHVSAETMHYHFDKHYLGYLAKVNAMVAGTNLAALPLEDMVRQAAWKRKRALLINAAQSWNHAFFWECLSPEGKNGPDLILAEALAKAFGSLEKFRQKFIEKGMAHFGSGWLWLAWHQDRGLMLSTTDNATPVWLASGRTPLLVSDLWEHAYYLDWKNDRAGWLEAFITDCANWHMAGAQLAALVNGTPTWRFST